ncbi:hypothetical protein VTK56DRAFT_9409 [Thermocarpiscus australiensis]
MSHRGSPAGSQAGSRAGSNAGSHSGSTPEVSTLEFDREGGTAPEAIKKEPWGGMVNDKSFGKKLKELVNAIPEDDSDFICVWVKFARIRGNVHKSSTAPEQGEVLSIQFLNAAKKRVIDTVHILSNKTIMKRSDFRKQKKQDGSK